MGTRERKQRGTRFGLGIPERRIAGDATAPNTMGGTMYAVIGAGPSGLAAARNLYRYGVPFVGFELHSDVGGLWDSENPHSTMYDSAHLISSKYTTAFEDFPMADDVAAYPSHREMRTYFRDYARHFELYRHFRFQTRVVSVVPSGARWLVTSEKDGTTTTEVFDGVLFANGTLHRPNIPTLPGDFAGELLHSADYKKAQQLEGKRVLVVGCGNSGADIAVEAVHHAASVDISLRRGYYFLPKFVGGRPIDTLGGKIKLPLKLKQRADAAVIRAVVGQPSDYGLPNPDYKLYESHVVMNTLILHHLGQGDIRPRRDIAAIDGHTVHFTDGESSDYDVLLLATGYLLDYPFVDRAHLNWPADRGAPALYLNIFNPDHPTLFMLGMVEAAGLGWEGRSKQSELVAMLLRQRMQRAKAAQAFEAVVAKEATLRIDGGLKYLKLDRMAYYVHKESYLAAIDAHMQALRPGLSAPQDAPLNQGFAYAKPTRMETP